MARPRSDFTRTSGTMTTEVTEMAKTAKDSERKDVAKRIESFLSRHRIPKSWEEIYDFNIKLPVIRVPQSIRDKVSEGRLSEFFNFAMEHDLEAFTEGLKTDYPWIVEWGQQGRSGGWLVLVSKDPVRDEWGEVPDLRRARKRLRDLEKIESEIRESMKSLRSYYETVEPYETLVE